MAKGVLRVYLGSAPGVGKTFAMLNEGWRRKQRGTDVVIGYLETHDRPNTAAQVRDLEIVPRTTHDYRGRVFEEMDPDTIIARRPEVALVDELAHTNAPGAAHDKRWQDVEQLLDAGVDVITTVNIQHLESLNDLVQRITGVAQRETVPDRMVRAADQVELVDMTPEALRRRMSHGNIYPADRIDAALSHYFRTGNLGALRELALLWLADKVDESLNAYRQRYGITEPWETKERVVVALTGSEQGERVIRRAARMAARARAELVGVHVRGADEPRRHRDGHLQAHRALLGDLGGRYQEVTGADPARALIDFARAENATQLLLGATARSRLTELLHGSVITKVIRTAGDIDVHVISSARATPSKDPTPAQPRVQSHAEPSMSPRIATSDVVERDELLEFVRNRHNVVLVTTKRDGTPQLSPVTAGVDGDGRVVIATYPERAKALNARRRAEVSLLVVSDDWNGAWVQVDGRAEVLDLPDALDPLVDYFRAIAGEHGDWDEYRAAMRRQGKALIRVTIDRWGPIATGGFPARLA